MQPIQVLIAEDNPSQAQALLEALSGEASLDVVGVGHDAGEAVALARERPPDVALVDVHMPGGGGPKVARELASLDPKPRVVALSASGDRAAVIEMLQAGAVAYLVKGARLDEIVDTVHRAARGLSTLSPSVSGEVIGSLVEQLERADAPSGDVSAALRRVRAVIETRAIECVYQPILELHTLTRVGYEALARFKPEPVRGPLEWFEDANAVGLGLELELTALRVALETVSTAGSSVLDTEFLAVNASPATVCSPEFAECFTDVRLDRVVVEVTEHAAIEDYRAFHRAFDPLRSAGARLAIDDAGAGYASLRHILQLKPDFIKLDLSLTRAIHADEPRRAMAAALVAFAEQTGSLVIAEGIETEDELDALRALGAGHGQGYHLGRPGALMPAGATG
jgi:EAL domain-containing protein (putative c-di-GMP-specific phosphodiesterase class I)/ActR/RegA family two-component response regulator